MIETPIRHAARSLVMLTAHDEDGLHMDVQHVSLRTQNALFRRQLVHATSCFFFTSLAPSSAPPAGFASTASAAPPAAGGPSSMSLRTFHPRPLVLGLHCRLSSHAGISKRIDAGRGEKHMHSTGTFVPVPVTVARIDKRVPGFPAMQASG